MSCLSPWAFNPNTRSRGALVYILVASGLVLLLGSCGTTNQLESKGVKNADEQIRVALDSGDLETARKLLEEQVLAEPTEYSRFVLLGAVYANLAGLDLTAALKGGAAGGSALDLIGTFLPAVTTAAMLELMQKAVDSITAVPAEKRQTTSTERYSTSAALQLGLYQAVYSVMYLRQFIAITADNKYDADKLRTMSAADAAAILSRLAVGATGSPIETSVQTTLAAIAATEGADDRERLINYMEATKR